MRTARAPRNARRTEHEALAEDRPVRQPARAAAKRP